jgi:ATP-dependent Clp protease protease subunit
MKNKKYLRVVNSAPGRAEIYLYGDISDEKWYDSDTTPAEVRDELALLKGAKEIDVYINSNGGGVFAGFAIYNILRRQEATINTYVDGIAASIASVILQSGSRRYAAKNSIIMIHNPLTVAMGYAEDLRKVADSLDTIREPIIDSYDDRSKIDRDKIVDLMDSETYMTADEALEWGFIDEIIDREAVSPDRAPEPVDLSCYEKVVAENDLQLRQYKIEN